VTALVSKPAQRYAEIPERQLNKSVFKERRVISVSPVGDVSGCHFSIAKRGISGLTMAALVQTIKHPNPIEAIAPLRHASHTSLHRLGWGLKARVGQEYLGRFT
jgi:hypothetical protein